MKRKNILDLSHPDLIHYLESIQEKSFRATQIFDWIYKKGVEGFEEMANLPAALRNHLKDNFIFPKQTFVLKETSRDGTTKFLFRLNDQERIETVLIPTSKRTTACISTQVGCKFGCQFCASGLNGWKRDLSCAEIIGQILYVEKYTNKRPLSHIVFMGIGEPLDNFDNLIKTVRIINSLHGMKIAARRITVSTCGLVPGINQLIKEGLQIELSVSLNGSNNKIRNTLMPVNKKYPLEELIHACRDYIKATNRQITFEYLLIKDLTCTVDAVQDLKRLLKGMICKLNLIPYNRISEFDYKPPGKLEVLAFQQRLNESGIHATIRMPRGKDINAACGQLRHLRQNNC